MGKRYLIIILGNYDGFDYDFNDIADDELGLHYVDGNGIFMGTFYSEYIIDEIHEMLVHIPAILIFDLPLPVPTKKPASWPSTKCVVITEIAYA